MPIDPMERLLETVRPAATGAGSNSQAVLHAAFDAVLHGDYERFAGLITETPS